MMLTMPPSGDFWYQSCLRPSLTLWETSIKIKSLHHTYIMAQLIEPASAAADHLAAPVAVLKSLMPNPPATNLKTPTFEWTTSDQYEVFKLFWESTESWFNLQAIPDDKGAHLEYILNFLSTTSHQKRNKWTPVSVTTDDIAATKSDKSFPDHLASPMDHTVSQTC